MLHDTTGVRGGGVNIPANKTRDSVRRPAAKLSIFYKQQGSKHDYNVLSK